jgi:hypothetical protein
VKRSGIILHAGALQRFRGWPVIAVRCAGEPFARNGKPTQHKAEALEMKLTDWLALIPAVQNGWTLAALIAVLLYLYFSRRGA